MPKVGPPEGLSVPKVPVSTLSGDEIVDDIEKRIRTLLDGLESRLVVLLEKKCEIYAAKDPASPRPRAEPPTPDWTNDKGVERSNSRKKIGTDPSDDVQSNSTSNNKWVTELTDRCIMSTLMNGDDVVEANCCGRMIKQHWFEAASSIIILCNAIMSGIFADYAVRHFDAEMMMFQRAIEFFFTILFALELLLRFFGEKRLFFSSHNRNRAWNIFDSIIVTTAIAEDIVGIFLQTLPNVSIVRVLRILKVTRVVRIIRVFRFYRDLRVMASGIAGSLRSLLWALIFLALVIYIYSTFLLQIIALEWRDSEHPDEHPLQPYFGSLFLCIYTLYMSICGGIDWGIVSNMLIDIQPSLGVTYSLYVGFCLFCFLNVVTGIFIRNASECIAADDEYVMREQANARRQFDKDVHKLFLHLDTAGKAELDWAAFQRVQGEPFIANYFKRVGVDISHEHLYELFLLLDFNGNGSLDKEEFAEGIHNLHGTARSIDVARLLHQGREICRRIDLLEISHRA